MKIIVLLLMLLPWPFLKKPTARRTFEEVWADIERVVKEHKGTHTELEAKITILAAEIAGGVYDF